MKRAYWEVGLVAAGVLYIVFALFGGLFSPVFALGYVMVGVYVLIAGHRTRHKS